MLDVFFRGCNDNIGWFVIWCNMWYWYYYILLYFIIYFIIYFQSINNFQKKIHIETGLKVRGFSQVSWWLGAVVADWEKEPMTAFIFLNPELWCTYTCVGTCSVGSLGVVTKWNLLNVLLNFLCVHRKYSVFRKREGESARESVVLFW